jgi:LCP family protein required for cell wall assembly
MTFKVRKIRRKSQPTWYQKLWKKRNPKYVLGLFWVLGVGGIITASVITLLPTADTTITPSTVVKKVNGLHVDKYGHTNILLLGVAGTMEEGGNLSDSIMIASLDQSRPSVSLLSLPRDLFVESKVHNRKINEVYAAARFKHGDQKGLEIIKEAVFKFTNVPIHYAAVVNFQIFSDAIDLIDGVEIFVPDTIEDPFYPDGNYGYDTFTIRRGLQTLDGETALKYVRSRKTTSDYDRAKRQQEVALAIRKKIESMGWASNVTKIKEFYDLFRRQVNTDVGLSEIISLARLGMGLDYGDIVSHVLNDDPNKAGGLLFTPAKEFYNGQFVLLPEDEKDTKAFVYLTLEDPDVLLENAQISVLNGSSVAGRAGEMAAKLRRLGFHVIETGNYRESAVIGTYIKSVGDTKKSKTITFLTDYLGAEMFPEQPTDESNPEYVDEFSATTETSSDGILDIEIILGE